MTLPYVSVIIATYRRDASLKRALLSLAGQTYHDFEIIVVDDNSNEEWNVKVKNIVEQFQKEHSNVKLKYIVNFMNMGSAKARNIGIDSSDGEYVTFLDDDDVYLPDKIETQIKGVLTNKADYSLTDLYLYNENDKIIDKRTRNYLVNFIEEKLLEYHFKYHMTGTDTFMFKRDYLISIGCFEPINVGDEFYLMQKAIQGGGKLYYQPECHVKAYVHTGEGGLSSGDGKIKGENELYEYKRAFFNQLKSRDVRYIKMRHYAVIAYAELRRKKYGKFASNVIKSFLSSPLRVFTILK